MDDSETTSEVPPQETLSGEGIHGHERRQSAEVMMPVDEEGREEAGVMQRRRSMTDVNNMNSAAAAPERARVAWPAARRPRRGRCASSARRETAHYDASSRGGTL